MDWWRRVWRVSLLTGALVLVTGMLATPAVAGPDLVMAKKGGTICAVTNVDRRSSHATLQGAVDAASAGDRIRVLGVCAGATTIDKNLEIAGVKRGRTPRATLDAQGAGRVLTITGGVTVTLRRLDIVNGSATVGGGVATTFGTDGRNIVTIVDSVIRNNTATDGGGIANDQGDVILVNTAVRDNRATGNGGGIHNSRFYGILTLRGSSLVAGNTAGGDAGGIYNDSYGAVTLEDSSSVSGNSAALNGGGIYVGDSVVTLTDSTSVRANSADVGGGVYVEAPFAVFDLIGSSTVSGNSPDNVCFGPWPGSAGCVS